MENMHNHQQNPESLGVRSIAEVIEQELREDIRQLRQIEFEYKGVLIELIFDQYHFIGHYFSEIWNKEDESEKIKEFNRLADMSVIQLETFRDEMQRKVDEYIKRSIPSYE